MSIENQYCPGDDNGSLPNGLKRNELDVILVFFDLKSEKHKRACRRGRTESVRMANELRPNSFCPTPGSSTHL
jgi:hypothetical protein